MSCTYNPYNNNQNEMMSCNYKENEIWVSVSTNYISNSIFKRGESTRDDVVHFQKQSLNQFVIDIFEREKNEEIAKGSNYLDYKFLINLIGTYIINNEVLNVATQILHQYLFVKNHRISPAHHIVYESNNFHYPDFDMDSMVILFNPEMLTRKVLIEKSNKTYTDYYRQRDISKI